MLISASPGPAIALILRRAAVDGWRGAVPTVLGLEAGLYLWALAAAAGFAALVAASTAAYVVLKVVGAGVLIWLGIKAWRAALKGQVELGETDAPAASWWRRFGEGMVVQLANPKAAVFMLAFYPQFVPADRPLFVTTAGLALLQVLLETVLYLSLAYGVGAAGAFFRRSEIRRRVEAVTGTVLVGLGLRVAVSSP